MVGVGHLLKWWDRDRPGLIAYGRVRDSHGFIAHGRDRDSHGRDRAKVS